MNTLKTFTFHIIKETLKEVNELKAQLDINKGYYKSSRNKKRELERNKSKKQNK